MTQSDLNQIKSISSHLRSTTAGKWGGLAMAVISLVAYLGLVGVHATQGTLTHGAILQSVSWIALAFIAYLGVILWSERVVKVNLRLIWVGALLFRVLLLFTSPTLSSDVYRYLWDGHVANNGVSPYAFPIDSAQMDALDVPIRALANHSWMASPYLPAAQWLFAGVTGVSPLHPRSMQIAMVAIDLLNGVLVFALLNAARLPGHRVLIYLWNPLAVVESAHGAHVDVWMVFLTLLAVWLALGQRSDSRRRWASFVRVWFAPVAFGLATLTKILPVLLLPVFFWEWRWRRLLIYAATIFVPLAVAGSRGGWGLTGPLDGEGLFAALRIYGDRWNFNSGLFHWLEVALAQSHRLNLSPAQANMWAKGGVMLLMATVMLAIWSRARTVRQVRAKLRLMSAPLMAYVLLTPTMHPWYLLLLLAFVPFLTPAADEWRGGWFVALPWVYLSGALYLSYFTYANPLDLREYELVRRIEWIPTLALLLLGIVSYLLHNRHVRNEKHQ